MKPSRRTTGVLLALTAAAALGLGTHASKKPETIGNVYVNGNTRDVVAALHNELNGKLNGTIDKTVTVIGSDSATTNAFANEFPTSIAVTANDLDTPTTKAAFDKLLGDHLEGRLTNEPKTYTFPLALKQTASGLVVMNGYNDAKGLVAYHGRDVKPKDLDFLLDGLIRQYDAFNGAEMERILQENIGVRAPLVISVPGCLPCRIVTNYFSSKKQSFVEIKTGDKNAVRSAYEWLANHGLPTPKDVAPEGAPLIILNTNEGLEAYTGATIDQEEPLTRAYDGQKTPLSQLFRRH